MNHVGQMNYKQAITDAIYIGINHYLRDFICDKMKYHVTEDDSYLELCCRRIYQETHII